MHDEIDVSVIICTRNRATALSATLKHWEVISPRCSWEIILIDNASTDSTADVIRAFCRLGSNRRYEFVGAVGLGAARDAAWRIAKGRLLTFTDDDCYPSALFVDSVLEVFDGSPDVGVVGGKITLFDSEDLRLAIDERSAPETYLPRTFVKAGSVHGANLSVRRDVLERIGGFDGKLGAGTPFPCEDVVLAADAIWSGSTIRYDPRPEVAHHHGRRAADESKIWMGYDRGRGAYFARFLLRRDSRSMYLTEWLRRPLKMNYPRELRSLVREIGSASEYAKSVGRPFAALSFKLGYLYLPFAAVVIAKNWTIVKSQRSARIAQKQETAALRTDSKRS